MSGEVELGFVQHDGHHAALREALEDVRRDPEVIGVLLCGSVARGDAYPGSDLDLHVLLREGCQRAFRSQVRQEVRVEYSYADLPLARSKLEADATQVYAYLDGRVLYDPQGELRWLVGQARQRYEGYRTPDEDKAALAYWLQSTRIKTCAAREAGDGLRAAYVVGASLWPILEGIWAANDRPMPPCGAVWAHLGDLSRAPPAESLLRRLFAGDATERVDTALEIIEWVVRLLEDPAAD